MSRGGKREKAGRKTTWESGARFEETSTLRVPNNIKDKLLKIAHRLDSGEDIDFESNSKIQYIQNLESRLAIAEAKNDQLSQQIENIEKYVLDLETKSKNSDLMLHELEQENVDLRRKLDEMQTINNPESKILEIDSKSNKKDENLVTNSKTVEQLILVDINPHETVEEIKPLKNSELARRLNVNASNLSKYSKLADSKFATYSASKDPDNIAWRYSKLDKLYYPLISNPSQK